MKQLTDREAKDILMILTGCAVNAALAKSYEAGYYGPWYDEAKTIAASEGALEVSVEDAEAPAAN